MAKQHRTQQWPIFLLELLEYLSVVVLGIITVFTFSYTFCVVGVGGLPSRTDKTHRVPCGGCIGRPGTGCAVFVCVIPRTCVLSSFTFPTRIYWFICGVGGQQASPGSSHHATAAVDVATVDVIAVDVAAVDVIIVVVIVTDGGCGGGGGGGVRFYHVAAGWTCESAISNPFACLLCAFPGRAAVTFYRPCARVASCGASNTLRWPGERI